MKKFRSLTQQNAFHIKVLNGEMGELRDQMKESNSKINVLDNKVDGINDSLVEQKTDMKWIKRVGSVTLGLLGALFVQLVLRGLG